MPDAKTDILIVGGGVIGLALTRKAASLGRDCVLIDSNPNFGMETSSRNSEVIHAGIYYPKDSLKGRLCLAGAKALYGFCETRNIKARNYGKLIVATSDEEVATLASIKAKGVANGVPGLEIISKQDLRNIEPHLHAAAALYSPLTGVIDSHHYMAQLEAEAEQNGATIAYLSRFVRADRIAGGGYNAVIDSQGQIMKLSCKMIINAGGHGAHYVSQNIDAVDKASVPPHFMAKGQYFSSRKKPPFSHLIYPVPANGGLGVHLTFDSGGGARFGPDIKWVDEMNYRVNPDDGAVFHAQISRYWPALERCDLVPAWAGVRPKITPDGSGFQDFTIHNESDHGAEGVIALYGIDSPGLTSSLALADYVLESGGESGGIE